MICPSRRPADPGVQDAGALPRLPQRHFAPVLPPKFGLLGLDDSANHAFRRQTSVAPSQTGLLSTVPLYVFLGRSYAKV